MRVSGLALAIILALALPRPGPAAFAATPPAGAAGQNGTGQNAMGHEGHAPMAPETPKALKGQAAPIAAAPAATSPTGITPAEAALVGVTEHLGKKADMDAEFLAEDGTRVRFGDLVTMPTILAPVYYSCPNECNVLLGTLANVLPQVGLTPGKDYQVLAVSFDDRDTPATASKRKGDFLNAGSLAASANFPPQAWRFLAGDETNIRKLMDSVGFGYKRAGDAFKHSIVLIALSPDGTITRYLYGIRPLAFDIAMAATEAAQGKTGLSVKRAIAMCYTYDPQGRKYVFDFMKVAGAGVLFALALFGLFLAFGGKKRGTPPTA